MIANGIHLHKEIFKKWILYEIFLFLRAISNIYFYFF